MEGHGSFQSPSEKNVRRQPQQSYSTEYYRMLGMTPRDDDPDFIAPSEADEQTIETIEVEGDLAEDASPVEVSTETVSRDTPAPEDDAEVVENLTDRIIGDEVGAAVKARETMISPNVEVMEGLEPESDNTEESTSDEVDELTQRVIQDEVSAVQARATIHPPELGIVEALESESDEVEVLHEVLQTGSSPAEDEVELEPVSDSDDPVELKTDLSADAAIKQHGLKLPEVRYGNETHKRFRLPSK